MKFSLSFFASLVLSSVALCGWNLNDVSYLLPLPENLQNVKLLNPLSEGLGGPLLNPSYFESLPKLTVELDNATIRNDLRLVAVRVDPCFPKPAPEVCQKQIRFVWQILRVGPRQNVETIDAAIHTFYTLDDTQFEFLLGDLKNWKAKYLNQDDNLPLQIHPAFKDEKALLDFQKIIAKYAGEKNISRATVMTVRNLGQTWGFVGADIVDQKLKVLNVARTAGNAQIFINQENPSNGFMGQMNPKPKNETAFSDTISDLITNSYPFLKADEATVRNEVQAALNIENPKLHNPNTMDCVSCHAAQPAREWLFKNHKGIDLNSARLSTGYSNKNFNLTNLTESGNTQIIRAFGYFQSKPAISQRVINESAEVADFLNKMAPTK